MTVAVLRIHFAGPSTDGASSNTCTICRRWQPAAALNGRRCKDRAACAAAIVRLLNKREA